MLDRDYQHGNGPDKEPWFGRFTSQMEDTCGSMPGALKCSSSFWTCANSSFFGVLRLCCVPQPTFTILGLARLAPLATLYTS